MIFHKKWIEILASLLLSIMIIYLAYYPTQQDFPFIIIPFLLSFVIYFLVLSSKKINFKLWVSIAFLLKAVLIFSFPNFSDDIYRFIWDGRLIDQGISPYRYIPSELVSKSIIGIDQSLFELLNSPNYYSVYPPINQIFFWISAQFSGGSIIQFSIITKCIQYLFDIGLAIGLIHLLKHFKLPKEKSLIYILNPLLIIELNANMHFEVIMIALFIWSIVHLVQEKLVTSALLLALSIGVKLVPIFFLPLFLKYLWTKKHQYKFIIPLIISGFIIALPLLLGVQWKGFANSLNLYFQKFEFNASLYYLLRWIGMKITGYNQIILIGPLLGIVSFSFLFFLAWRKKITSVLHLLYFALIALSVYYFCTTTMHPWYLSFLVVLSVFTPFKYALVWSAMICLSYIHYYNGVFEENYYLIFIAYVVVAWFLWKDVQVLKKSKLFY